MSFNELPLLLALGRANSDVAQTRQELVTKINQLRAALLQRKHTTRLENDVKALREVLKGRITKSQQITGKLHRYYKYNLGPLE